MKRGHARSRQSRLDGDRFLASENRHRSRPRLVPRLLLRRRRFRATLLPFIVVAAVCVFGFIDPVPYVSRRFSSVGLERASIYQLLPTMLMPLASAIL